jgi:hypothetical protein
MSPCLSLPLTQCPSALGRFFTALETVHAQAVAQTSGSSTVLLLGHLGSSTVTLSSGELTPVLDSTSDFSTTSIGQSVVEDNIWYDNASVQFVLPASTSVLPFNEWMFPVSNVLSASKVLPLLAEELSFCNLLVCVCVCVYVFCVYMYVSARLDVSTLLIFVLHTTYALCIYIYVSLSLFVYLSILLVVISIPSSRLSSEYSLRRSYLLNCRFVFSWTTAMWTLSESLTAGCF